MSAHAIVSAAEQNGYGTFAAALRASSHVTTLQGSGPFTVFAPTDAAFEKFSRAAREQLLEGDPALLHLVMGYHFAAGRVVGAQFAGKRIRAVMQAGGDVIIDGRAGLKVNAARVVQQDILASNGVIHGVDSVLWPKAPSSALGAA
jgi:uncharacterized surface protein with fasciclin (FAS1) repeats